MSIVAPGAYYRPYETRNLSELHSHLIQTPIAIAVPTATSTFEERYFYVLNANGSLSVGKYAVASGQIKGVVGLLPWSGAGTVNSVAALNADVLFSTTYPGAAFAVIELLDDTQVMDSSILVNNLPANIIAPPGKGPLWWIAGGSVNLFDGARPLGTYKVDVNGNLIPQFIGGENLTSLTLVAGQTWTATFEPFVPPAQPGQDRSQRLRKRRISRAEIYVSSSTGFRLDTLYTEQQGANLNPPGTITKTRRVPTYNQGDDPTLPPRLFERAYAFKPTGRAHDPRIAVVKDTSGPLVIEEVSLQVTV